MGIGSVLQNLLDKNNCNVNEVALATGVSPSTLYSIIRRDSMSANIEDLYKVAHYLGVTLDYFYPKKENDDQAEFFSTDEKDLIQKYRSLDDYSKESVRLFLQREYNRSRKCLSDDLKEKEL